MRYLVTGGTGLIGRELVPRLLARGGEVHLLLRPGSRARHAARLAQWQAGPGTVHLIEGDIEAPDLGLAGGGRLPADLDHTFHLAARYDLAAPDAELERANVAGTQHVIDALRRAGFRGVLHHASSIAVAGDHRGRLAEEDLDVGQHHGHPYHRTKFDSERLVRQSGLRWRVYRPSAIVGHSQTGEMPRVDGPYYLFLPLRKLRDALPAWLPVIAPFRMPLNMVPVDYVAAAIDLLAHDEGHDGQTFHVVDPDPPSFRETWNLLAAAAGAPRLAKVGGGKLLERYLPGAAQMIAQLGSVKFLRQEILADLGIPAQLVDAINRDVRYDTAQIDAALAGRLACPRQADYLPTLWDYWLRHLDPERAPEIRRRAFWRGKTVLITGASSGVGAALARAAAAAGSRVILVARREAELAAVAQAVQDAGGEARYHVADLNDFDACDRVVVEVLDEHGAIDVLVNNAARSIRRPLHDSLARFHDFERIFRLNYFAPIRLIRGFLPAMRERGSGYLVNVLTAGVVLPTPLFAAYGSSKAALSHLTDTLGAEFYADGIRCTGVYLPFVRTPMMDAEVYDEKTRALTPDRAAELILDGVAAGRSHIITKDFVRRAVVHDLAPTLVTRVLSLVYRLSYEDDEQSPELALDRMLLKRFVKGRVL